MSTGSRQNRRIYPPVWLYESKVSVVHVNTTQTKILEANNRRVSLFIANGGIASIYVWPGVLSAQPWGFLLDSNTTFREFTYNNHPSFVTGEWYAIEINMGADILIAECLANP